ncbi:hypothetical protein CDAR_611871 [Caerostris darwini]|uniref:Uncharacterized protein n=1 Tax=Caerostris darwini TaxID=1538125 RepID=A0AAV4MSM8_9ARAC|nr:hypothetical protein CDAR_611871 [Caerostris darwini]
MCSLIGERDSRSPIYRPWLEDANFCSKAVVGRWIGFPKICLLPPTNDQNNGESIQGGVLRVQSRHLSRRSDSAVFSDGCK